MKLEFYQTFETEQFIIRPLRVDDFDGLQQKIYTDPHVRRFYGQLQTYTDSGDRVCFALDTPVGHKVRKAKYQGFGVWVVFGKAQPSCGLRWLDCRPQQ
ncbi:hypothetical protein IH992_22040 [Candidatus Poribacteria bacterium]|nr:hypothetical protein [Candidatus Poribacteria bacterium]